MSVPTLLDRDRVREIFNLRGPLHYLMGGGFEDDPYPLWHELRASGPLHPGTVHELTGVADAIFHGLPEAGRPHYSLFGWQACDAAFRDAEVFASSPHAIHIESGQVGTMNSMLSMDGRQHRRYRGLVQPSFVPLKAEWWMRNYIEQTVQLLIDGFAADGRAELNVDFCAAIPVLTITNAFGVPVERALDIRESLGRPEEIVAVLAPVVAARRQAPQDDLISVLVEAELAGEDGVTHRLSDAEIYSFAMLLLQAGSGTTWKQMGITLTALLSSPDALRAVRQDRTLLKAAIEESLRWEPTDPMFSRWVTRDIDLYGTRIPQGAVVHICLGSANRDPARWERPDEFDILRPRKAALAFGNGPHVCLGMHVARAEMSAGIGALLDRLPNLRLDPEAEPPRVIGLYERGATTIPVIWDQA